MGMTPGEWHAQSAFAGAEILSEDGMLIADVFTREDAAAMVQLPALVALVKDILADQESWNRDSEIVQQVRRGNNGKVEWASLDYARALLRALGEG